MVNWTLRQAHLKEVGLTQNRKIGMILQYLTTLNLV